MYDDEEIYDDTGDSGSNMNEPTGLSALKARFEQTQNATPSTGPKPLTPKPKPPQKYGGGGGLNICAVGEKKEGGAPVALNEKNAVKEENDFVARVKPPGVSSGVPLKKRDSKVNIPEAFLHKVENTPGAIKPKPSIKPNKWSSDSNNNAKVNGVTAELENVLAHKRPSITSTSKQSDSENTSGGKVSPRDKSTDSSIPKSPDSPKRKTSPKIASGVGVLAQVARFAGDSNAPLDFRSKLKHVDQKKNSPSSFSVSPKPLNDIDSKDVPWRNNLKSALFRERTKSIRSVIRVSDGKKFLKVDDSSLSDDGPPQKPEKLDCDIDLTSLETDFKEAVESIVVSEKEQHGWTEVEEMYDDCGNLRPVSTRAVSFMGTGPKPKPRKRVPLIEPMTEDEELREEQWKNAGFNGIPELPEDLPAPPPEPSDNTELLDQQETYDDVAVAEVVPEEGLEQDEMYEELPDEPLPESSPPSLGPKPPAKPPEVPSTPLPKTPNTEKTENENSENKPATDQASIDAKEQKRLEKERKKKEKEEKKLLETKEKELKKLLKVLGHKVTPELLTTSVGKGKVKSNAKGKEKTGDLTVAEGDEVDIIRMIDNPAGKWLVRILSSQKDKEQPHGPYSPLERIGYCDEKNIEVDTSSILNYMKGSGGQNSGTSAPSEQDQETYEAVDEAENPIEDEIYEECN